VNGAGAALRDAASVLGAGQPDLFAYRPQQGRARFNIDIVVLSVNVKSCHEASYYGYSRCSCLKKRWGIIRHRLANYKPPCRGTRGSGDGIH
jgi:hypothetical protein